MGKGKRDLGKDVRAERGLGRNPEQRLAHLLYRWETDLGVGRRLDLEKVQVPTYFSGLMIDHDFLNSKYKSLKLNYVAENLSF